MNYLKTDILKKEFKNFVDKILPAVQNVGHVKHILANGIKFIC